MYEIAISHPPDWALKASRIHPDSVVTWVRTISGIGLWPSVLIVTGDEVAWVKRGMIGARAMRTERNSIRSSDFVAGVIWDNLCLEVDVKAFSISEFRVSKDDRDEVYNLLFHLKQDEF